MRLIDADELKAVIDGYDYSEEGYADMINFDFLYEVIDKQPTSYDIEKVVYELEKNSHAYTTVSDLGIPSVGRKVYLKDAIEIVKGGAK